MLLNFFKKSAKDVNGFNSEGFEGFFLAEKNGVMKIKLSEIVLQICSKSLSLIKGGLK